MSIYMETWWQKWDHVKIYKNRAKANTSNMCEKFKNFELCFNEFGFKQIIVM